MKTQTIFEHTDYKPYLSARLEEKGYGARKRLSEAMGVQPSFVAQVLNGDVHLSPEQTEEANQFLLHSEMEASYFFTLVQYCRAGTPKLKHRLFGDLEELRAKSKSLKHRLKKAPKVNEADMLRYYSSWIYMATHALCSMDEFNSAREIAQRLDVGQQQIEAVLAHLESNGLIKKTRGKISVEKNSFHLDGDSPLVIQHHGNWRMKAMRSFEKLNADNLHYTSVITVSNREKEEIREVLLAAIEKVREIIAESNRQELMLSFCTDLFEV